MKPVPHPCRPKMRPRDYVSAATLVVSLVALGLSGGFAPGGGENCACDRGGGSECKSPPR
jgi:hypothetical protein